MSNKWIEPRLLDLRFEFVYRALGKNGKHLSHDAKCLGLVLILYAPGVLTNLLTGTLRIFIFQGWGFFLSNILLGIIVWLMIGFLEDFNDRIAQVSRIIAPPNPKKQPKLDDKKSLEIWNRWEESKKNYVKWTSSLSSVEWYYFDTLGMGLLSFSVGKLIIVERIGWASANIFNGFYFLAWIALLGYIAGATIYFVFAGFWAIRRYCRSVLSHQYIMPFNPDHTGGLRQLGYLSLDLDLIVALPSLAFLIYLPQNPKLLGAERTAEFIIGLSLLYTLLLVLVFFISISPAHDKMKEAKFHSIEKIHEEYRDMHEQMNARLSTREQLDPVDYQRLTGLYSVYDRVQSMAVWPLDYRIMLRFLVTSVLPMIASVITVSLW